ncbi:ribonuclease CAF1 [Neoconidiobolus thromboides FSU 785]|nr:ribonuclease CAF1 [Neoconidiobolus thromboides FSU 785]
MDIGKSNFAIHYPEIEKAINTCSFISFDAEFSGLDTYNTQEELSSDENESIYYNMKKRMGDYKIIQIGLSVFHQIPVKPIQYQAKVYNFYIFPAVTDQREASSKFVCHPSAINFLCNEGFDFNKLFYDGIPYLTTEEEAKYKESKMRIMDNKRDLADIDERGKAFMKNKKEEIVKFLEGSELELPITCPNNYFRILIYQNISAEYSTSLMAKGTDSGVLISRFNKKEYDRSQKKKLNKIEREIKEKVGFRKVIDCMIKSKKPLIGHNMFLDICHLLKQFVITPLPDSYKDFLTVLREKFPVIYDTKFLFDSAFNLNHNETNDSSLLTVRTITSKTPYPKVKIKFYEEHNKYLMGDGSQHHEAGYDAFVTGEVFLTILAKAGNYLMDTLKYYCSILVANENKKYKKYDWDYLYKSTASQENKNRLHISRGSKRFIAL